MYLLQLVNVVLIVKAKNKPKNVYQQLLIISEKNKKYPTLKKLHLLTSV